MPVGLNTIMSTMAAPNRSMRYSENCRKYSGSRIMTLAPRITPTTEPMPPMTTMTRMSTDSQKEKLGGLINVLLAAKTTPAMLAQVAPRAKAMSLVLVLSTPMA